MGLPLGSEPRQPLCAGRLPASEDLEWRAPDPGPDGAGVSSMISHGRPFRVLTLKQMPDPGVCQQDNGWGRLGRSHQGGDMAGKEPSVQILTRSRLLSATAGLAPRGGEPGVQADSLCVHTCTLVPTRVSRRGPRGPYVTKRQDTPVQFPGVSHANTDGPTRGHGQLHACPQRHRKV